MSNQQNCNACADLQADAPNLIVNGLGDTECTSLANNTGLNPSSGNDDCTDLHNLNDCLVGNMEQEVDAYDVCDWKEFMKKLIPNIWTTLKGIICAVCGLWSAISEMYNKIDAICALVNANLDYPVLRYGMNPNIDVPAQKGGAIPKKGGYDVLVALPRSSFSDSTWPMQNVGFYYGKMNSQGCDESCYRHEWIAPNLYGYKFHTSVNYAYGDVLWSIDKASVIGRMGMSQKMWDTRAENPISWSTWTVALNNGTRPVITLRLAVENDRLELSLAGILGATYADLPGNTIVEPASQQERHYKWSCATP